MNAAQLKKKIREIERTAKHYARVNCAHLPFLAKMRESYQAQLDKLQTPTP